MKRLKKTALFTVSATILAGQLYAQPTPPSPPADDKAAARATVQLSPEQMKREALSHRARVRADLQRVQHLQARARKEKDVIKLTCVNDKFVRLKAEANVFDEAHRELLVALESNDRNAMYMRVTVSSASVHKVREEADACIGEPELGAESANDFTAPEIIDDPTLGLPFDIEIEPPAYASPYI